MTTEEIQDIIQWDVQSWSKALHFWDSTIKWDDVKNGLELGGREGGLSLWLALKGKDVVCSDLKNVKLTAEPLHKRYGVTARIHYADIDASDIPYENEFDIVVFKSIIGGIGSNENFEKQKLVFKQIHKALKPGGKLLFAENLVASPFHKILRKRFVNWGTSWRYITLEEMNTFLSDYSSSTIQTTGVLATFGRTEKQRKLFAKLDFAVLNRIIPNSWKYIVYGVAVK